MANTEIMQTTHGKLVSATAILGINTVISFRTRCQKASEAGFYKAKRSKNWTILSHLSLMTRSYFLPCLACLSMSATAILIQALDILNIFCVPAISKTVSISQNYFSSWQTATFARRCSACSPSPLPIVLCFCGD